MRLESLRLLKRYSTTAKFNQSTFHFLVMKKKTKKYPLKLIWVWIIWSLTVYGMAYILKENIVCLGPKWASTQLLKHTDNALLAPVNDICLYITEYPVVWFTHTQGGMNDGKWWVGWENDSEDAGTSYSDKILKKTFISESIYLFDSHSTHWLWTTVNEE